MSCQKCQSRINKQGMLACETSPAIYLSREVPLHEDENTGIGGSNMPGSEMRRPLPLQDPISIS